MLRKGVPPPLRCAVWISNVIQSTHPHQEVKYAHEYRTLAKVRVLDHAYDALWMGENAPLSENALNISNMKGWATFGNKSLLTEVTKYPNSGQLALLRVLHALDFVLGVEYAPMIPTLAILFLSTMSQSYVFTAIREMAHHSSWYWPCSVAEHVAHERAFLDVLSKLHPGTGASLDKFGVGPRLTEAIFQNFFRTVLPEKCVWRIVDIYTLEGTKALFRFGVALAVLYQKYWKDVHAPPEEGGDESTGSRPMSSGSSSTGEEVNGDDWWSGLVAWSHSDLFNWEFLVRKAYGVHGKGVRKRYRFPRRPILSRILKLEEENYMIEQQNEATAYTGPIVRPLGLVVSENERNALENKEAMVPKLAEPVWVRTKLAEYLPVSLRLTKMDLIYSTNYHGRTLESLYRHCERAKHTIVLVEPLDQNVSIQAVGMYASQTWIPSTRVYGDGECFMFRLSKDDNEASKCWKWRPGKPKRHDVLEEDGAESAANNQTALLEQFQVGTNNYISMGGNADGTSGLRLNEDLTKGESAPASGFNNEPLAYGGLFEVGLVEVYQLVRQMDGVAVG
jgi:hypothetical protein